MAPGRQPWRGRPPSFIYFFYLSILVVDFVGGGGAKGGANSGGGGGADASIGPRALETIGTPLLGPIVQRTDPCRGWSFSERRLLIPL